MAGGDILDVLYLTQMIKKYALTIISVLYTVIFSVQVWAQAPPSSSTGISAVWANNGEDKITRDELRASSNPSGVINSLWDGATIRLFGARNEVWHSIFVWKQPSGWLMMLQSPSTGWKDRGDLLLILGR